MLEQIDILIAFALIMLLLSLLIMTLVQAATVLFQRRGRHLLWGVAQILQQMGADRNSAKAVAKAVLFHPALSPSRWVLASAIRPEELVRLLEEVLTRPGFVDAATQNAPWVKNIQADPAMALANLKAWFDMIMDRTTESFVAWTRTITVGFACALCVLFQVDALDILQKLSADKEVRSRLVAQVEPTLKEAEAALANASSASALGSEAIKRLHKKLSGDPKTAADAKLLENVPANLDTRTKGREWLIQAIRDPQKQKSILEQYDVEFEALTTEKWKDLRLMGTDLAEQLGKSQLTIFRNPRDLSGYTDWHHAAGIIMAALLLSLGAPFWFNTLRNLSNLRPILANRVEPERGK